MLLYLDLNCFNRPFDDQSQERIARETEAVLHILQRALDGTDALAWSAVLTFENSKHPIPERRDEIGSWAQRATIQVGIDGRVSRRARELAEGGINPLDAAHLACAEVASCDRFLTCDDRLLSRVQRFPLELPVQNPWNYVKDLRDDDRSHR